MKRHIIIPIMAGLVAIAASCQHENDFMAKRESGAEDRLPMEGLTESANADGTLGGEKEVYDFRVHLTDADRMLKVHKPDLEVRTVECLVERGDTLAYLYNFDEGWMVISGDKRLPPVLGNDANGHFHMGREGERHPFFEAVREAVSDLRKDMTAGENEQTKIWDMVLRRPGLRKGIRRVPPEDGLPPAIQSYCWKEVFDYSRVDTLSKRKVSHLIQTKWGQGAPWNQSCPVVNGVNCLVGCVAVANGQIIYYLHYRLGKPTGLWHQISYYGNPPFYSFNRAGWTDPSLRWDLMALNTSGTTMGKEYVADFLLDVGARAGMKYGVNASGSSAGSSAFLPYSINCTSGTYNYATVKNQLDNRLPVEISGRDSQQGDHMWIIDGYQEYTLEYITAVHLEYADTYDPSLGEAYYNEVWTDWYDPYWGKQYIYSSTANFQNLYMNWGWNGNGDGSLYPTTANWSVSGYLFNTANFILYDFN